MRSILYSMTGKIFRKYYNYNNRKKLFNKEFSLITNNCLGGIIYHDLNVKFNSPTINLYFSDPDFLKFTKRIEYYLSKDMQEKIGETSDNNYPIGILDDIEIHFLHYSSFNEAKKKWNERAKRVRFDNLFIIMTDTEGDYSNLIKEFEKIPHNEKILLSHLPVITNNTGFYIKGFEKRMGLGILWDYQNILGKKYYEQFNFIKWFNSTISR